jgi:hypothetical protein
MDTAYEIFKKHPEGPIWIESVTRNKIAERLDKLGETIPGECFVYAVHEARIVAEFPGEPNNRSTIHRAI